MGERIPTSPNHTKSIVGGIGCLGSIGIAFYGGMKGVPELYIGGFVAAVVNGTIALVGYSTTGDSIQTNIEMEDRSHNFKPNPEFPIKE